MRPMPVYELRRAMQGGYASECAAPSREVRPCQHVSCAAPREEAVPARPCQRECCAEPHSTVPACELSLVALGGSASI